MASTLAVTRSQGVVYGIFVAFGISLGMLQTAANVYITVYGTPRHSVFRINFAHCISGASAVAASAITFLIGQVHWRGPASTAWACLVLAIQWSTCALAMYLNLPCWSRGVIPEITDADMQNLAGKVLDGESRSVSHRLVNSHRLPFFKQYRLFIAAAARFTYVGAQVATVAYLDYYVHGNLVDSTTLPGGKVLLIALGTLALGEIVGTAIIASRILRPTMLLLVCLFSANVALLNPSVLVFGGIPGTVLIFLSLVFQAICSPTIFALGLLGLATHTKPGAGLMNSTKVGGACFTSLMLLVASRSGNVNVTMAVPAGLLCICYVYAIVAVCSKQYSEVVNAFWEAPDGIVSAQSVSGGRNGGHGVEMDDRADASSK
ncbi:hypothetical protein B0H67DRAFT_680091 [Lasiosphaeris hirsuta]|uniref:Uncharacterized protein n=1 Tax=Lasiosphaeris hirsuta TaxID=260670 RepID=A0AA40E5B7_9PEZI|nr:hypothetical protein B0H67DRAFT_680091 [Lasiosphaeris hirsuta]